MCVCTHTTQSQKARVVVVTRQKKRGGKEKKGLQATEECHRIEAEGRAALPSCACGGGRRLYQKKKGAQIHSGVCFGLVWLGLFSLSLSLPCDLEWLSMAGRISLVVTSLVSLFVPPCSVQEGLVCARRLLQPSRFQCVHSLACFLRHQPFASWLNLGISVAWRFPQWTGPANDHSIS